MNDLERITSENNLGIYGDAQDTLELAGRGIALVGTLLHVLDEATVTRERLEALIPHRVQLSRKKGWRMPDNTVSVARPHRWGNPFSVAEFGLDAALRLFGNTVRGVWSPTALDQSLPDEVFDSAYEKHGEWLKRLGGHPIEMARVELGGRNLACFCPLPAPGEPDLCHARFFWISPTRGRVTSVSTTRRLRRNDREEVQQVRQGEAGHRIQQVHRRYRAPNWVALLLAVP